MGFLSYLAWRFRNFIVGCDHVNDDFFREAGACPEVRSFFSRLQRCRGGVFLYKDSLLGETRELFFYETPFKDRKSGNWVFAFDQNAEEVSFAYDAVSKRVVISSLQIDGVAVSFTSFDLVSFVALVESLNWSDQFRGK